MKKRNNNPHFLNKLLINLLWFSFSAVFFPFAVRTMFAFAFVWFYAQNHFAIWIPDQLLWFAIGAQNFSSVHSPFSKYVSIVRVCACVCACDWSNCTWNLLFNAHYNYICIWCVICSLTVRSFGSFSSEIYRALIWNQLRAAYFAIHSKTICSKIMVNHQIFIWWCFDFCSIHLRTTGLNQQNSLFANRSFHAGRMEQHSNENPF